MSQYVLNNGCKINDIRHIKETCYDDYNFSEYYNYKYDIAKKYGATKILEIGVRAGYAAHAFLTANPEATYTGIDMETDDYGGYSEFNTTEHALNILRKYNPTLYITNSHSLFKIYGSFDFIHIDGDHSFIGAYMDMVLTWHSLTKDGVMIVDDYLLLPPVKKAVDRFIEDNKCYHEELKSHNGDMLLRKL